MPSRRRPLKRRSDAAPRVAALICLAALSCGVSEGGSSSALEELERLAFVPDGQLVLPPGRETVGYKVSKPLLVDMFEVTRAEWLRFQRVRADAVEAELLTYTRAWESGSGSLPASYMTQTEADEYARWRGMRLPTAGEWLYCVIGSQRRPYPWGSTDQRGTANTLELRLERPAAVGTFESGRTGQFLYDTLGNVAEWTLDLAAGSDGLSDDARVSAMGGSFRTWSRPIFDPRPSPGQPEVFARALPPESRSDDVGLRCCVDARTYLAQQLGQVRDSQEARRRLTAVGKRWGVRALPLLDELAKANGPSPSLSALSEGARQ